MDIVGEMSFRELPCKLGDGEEPLSLSHLPLTSNCSDWEEDYLFEFSSEDFSASCDALNLADNVVIFCGKLIPYREVQVPIRAQEIKPKEAGKRPGRLLFMRRSNVNKPRTSSSTCKQGKSTNEVASKGGRVGVDLAMRKMPVLSSPLKSRWYLFAFGVGRFPMTMERSDMKTRQSKKSRAIYPTSDRREMSNSSSGGSSNRSGGRPRSSFFWSILNNIGCKNQYLMECPEQHRL